MYQFIVWLHTNRRWARPWIFSHRYQIGWTVLMLICW